MLGALPCQRVTSAQEILHCFPGSLLLRFPAVFSIYLSHSAGVCRYQTVTIKYFNHVPTFPPIECH